MQHKHKFTEKKMLGSRRLPTWERGTLGSNTGTTWAHVEWYQVNSRDGQVVL